MEQRLKDLTFHNGFPVQPYEGLNETLQDSQLQQSNVKTFAPSTIVRQTRNVTPALSTASPVKQAARPVVKAIRLKNHSRTAS